MKTFEEYYQHRDASYNELWNPFARKKQTQPAPVSNQPAYTPPSNQDRSNTMKGAAKQAGVGIYKQNNQPTSIYTQHQLNTFGKGQDITSQIKTGFKEAIDRIRGKFGTKGSDFFNGIQRMTDKFIDEQLVPRIKVKMGGGEQVGLRNQNIKQAYNKYG